MPIAVDDKPKEGNEHREWQGLDQMPKYLRFQKDFAPKDRSGHALVDWARDPKLAQQMAGTGLDNYMKKKKSTFNQSSQSNTNNKLELLSQLLRLDPLLRLSAQDALKSKYFKSMEGRFSPTNIFKDCPMVDGQLDYPKRSYKETDANKDKKPGSDAIKPYFPQAIPPHTSKRAHDMQHQHQQHPHQHQQQQQQQQHQQQQHPHQHQQRQYDPMTGKPLAQQQQRHHAQRHHQHHTQQQHHLTQPGGGGLLPSPRGAKRARHNPT